MNLVTAALVTIGVLATIATAGLAGWLWWRARQPGRIRKADRTGAGPGWSPAADVAAHQTAPELLTVQTKAEQAAEQEAIAHPIDDDVNARIDAALDAFRAACDHIRDQALPGEEYADQRAYLLRAEIHRHPDHTPDTTAAMHFRAALDQMLAADGRDQLVGAAR
jgi:hypothetical protein